MLGCHPSRRPQSPSMIIAADHMGLPSSMFHPGLTMYTVRKIKSYNLSDKFRHGTWWREGVERDWNSSKEKSRLLLELWARVHPRVRHCILPVWCHQHPRVASSNRLFYPWHRALRSRMETAIPGSTWCWWPCAHSGSVSSTRPRRRFRVWESSPGSCGMVTRTALSRPKTRFLETLKSSC